MLLYWNTPKAHGFKQRPRPFAVTGLVTFLLAAKTPQRVGTRSYDMVDTVGAAHRCLQSICTHFFFLFTISCQPSVFGTVGAAHRSVQLKHDESNHLVPTLEKRIGAREIGLGGHQPCR